MKHCYPSALPSLPQIIHLVLRGLLLPATLPSFLFYLGVHLLLFPSFHTASVSPWFPLSMVFQLLALVFSRKVILMIFPRNLDHYPGRSLCIQDPPLSGFWFSSSEGLNSGQTMSFLDGCFCGL